MSPDLFSLYTQLVMDELVECEGVGKGGKSVNIIRYADKMVLIADSEGKLQILVIKTCWKSVDGDGSELKRQKQISWKSQREARDFLL